ncbi:Rep family protein [Glaciibacter sp. 2TAF33]|uniref:Rep family protein n=1 Tax=Glaciibacter sp. 2TAF33 TaxID=3233015 RepID=UPI003F8FB7E8
MGVSEDTRTQGATAPDEVQPKRPRRFRVASQTLNRDSIAHALDRPNVTRYAGIVHDKDPDVRTHAHVVFELSDGRTFQTVANMLNVPLILVRSVIGQRGDTHSFARAVRYLTHETPTEQAKGKYRYADEEVFASAGYKWRAEVDALSAQDRYQLPLLDRLKIQVLHGDRSARSVLDEYPSLDLKHDAAFKKLELRFMTEFATAAQREERIDEYRRRAESRD